MFTESFIGIICQTIFVKTYEELLWKSFSYFSQNDVWDSAEFICEEKLSINLTEKYRNRASNL